MYRLEEFLYI